MAIKPADNEAFFREVDEELRRAQLTGIWQRYGKGLVVGVVLLLILFAGVLYWQHHQEKKAGEQAEQLSAVFDDIQANKIKEVAPRLDTLAKDGTPGYRAAALLTKADMALEEGREADAVAGYKAIAENADFAEPYRQLALIRQTSAEYEKLQPQAVIDRLKGLAVAGNPWFGSAGELVAIAYMKQGKPQLAGPIFAAMAKDKQLPDTVRSRAIQMAGSLGIDAVPDTETGDAAATKEAQ